MRASALHEKQFPGGVPAGSQFLFQMDFAFAVILHSRSYAFFRSVSKCASRYALLSSSLKRVRSSEKST